MSEVASGLGVTLGTLTASVNRLVHKGVGIPVPSGRKIGVLFSSHSPRKGRVAHSIHERFHRRMIDGPY